MTLLNRVKREKEMKKLEFKDLPLSEFLTSVIPFCAGVLTQEHQPFWVGRGEEAALPLLRFFNPFMP
jgi:hypothetical protein